MTQEYRSQGVSIKGFELIKLWAYLLQEVHQHLKGKPPPAPNRKQVVVQFLEKAFTQTKALLPRNTKSKLFTDILSEFFRLNPILTLLENKR